MSSVGRLDQELRIAIFDDYKSAGNHILPLLNQEMMFTVVGIYNNLKNSVNNLVASRPDLVLIDINTAGPKGIETLEQLKKELPHIQFLVLTSSEDEAQIYHSIMAGASGYILKHELKDKLVEAIKELRTGGSPMSSSVARKVINMIKWNVCHLAGISSPVDYKLTGREKEVLACIVKGKNYKMTGYELNISYETVRSHMKKIYEKLHVGSLTEAVAKSINFNIV